MKWRGQGWQFWRGLRRHLSGDELAAFLSANKNTADPRTKARTPAYDPTYQADEAQFAMLAQEWAKGMVPMPDAIRATDARWLPPQLRYTPFAVTIGATTTQLELIPCNPYRMAWIAAVVDLNQSATFTYGPSVFTDGAGNWQGIALNPSFQEANGTVSIDSIFVQAQTIGANGTQIIGYEGVLAFESHFNG